MNEINKPSFNEPIVFNNFQGVKKYFYSLMGRLSFKSEAHKENNLDNLFVEKVLKQLEVTGVKENWDEIVKVTVKKLSVDTVRKVLETALKADVQADKIIKTLHHIAVKGKKDKRYAEKEVSGGLPYTKEQENIYIEFEQILGRGTYKTVYKGTDLSGTNMAPFKMSSGIEDFAKEKAILDKLQGGPHIVSGFKGITQTNDELYGAQELYDGGTIRDKWKDGPLSANTIKKLGMDTADALAFCHSKGIVHCDVKPDNVILREEEGYLTDFGSATEVGGRITTFSPKMAPPEVFHPTNKADGKFDSYGLGMLLCCQIMSEAVPPAPPSLGPSPKTLEKAKNSVESQPNGAQLWAQILKEQKEKYDEGFAKFQNHIDGYLTTVSEKINTESDPLEATKKREILEVARALMALKPEDRISCEEASKRLSQI